MPAPASSVTVATRSQRPSSAELLAEFERSWGGRSDLWVFGYASLIWRPEFDAAEHRSALVYGWHQSLRMRSTVNRGTPERPGLVFALLRGGACQGAVYRIPRARVRQELQRLWLREMPNGVYDPRWVRARTPKGVVPALASKDGMLANLREDLEQAAAFKEAARAAATHRAYGSDWAIYCEWCGSCGLASIPAHP